MADPTMLVGSLSSDLDQSENASRSQLLLQTADTIDPVHSHWSLPPVNIANDALLSPPVDNRQQSQHTRNVQPVSEPSASRQDLVTSVDTRLKNSYYPPARRPTHSSGIGTSTRPGQLIPPPPSVCEFPHYLNANGQF